MIWFDESSRFVTTFGVSRYFGKAMYTYTINISVNGQHWAKVVLPDGTMEEEARAKLAVLQARLTQYATYEKHTMEILSRWGKCKYCETKTEMHGTRLCDNCWEVAKRIRNMPPSVLSRILVEEQNLAIDQIKLATILMDAL